MGIIRLTRPIKIRWWRCSGKLAAARGWEVAESLIANAEPAGKTLRKAYEGFRDEILTDLKAALPVDAVLLDLHGAMVADGYDDCEGDLIASVRQVVGADVPIGVELDLHCHITEKMVNNATIIITYKEYPHTDTADRALELFNLIADTVEGKIHPTMGVFDCRMIGLFYPTAEPMKSYVARMKALEGKNGVLSVSLAHCFPWGDVPDLGAKTLVVTDNNPAQAAQLGGRAWDANCTPCATKCIRAIRALMPHSTKLWHWANRL